MAMEKVFRQLNAKLDVIAASLGIDTQSEDWNSPTGPATTTAATPVAQAAVSSAGAGATSVARGAAEEKPESSSRRGR